MPVKRVEKVLSDDGNIKRIEVEVGERGTTKTAQYMVPSTPASFLSMVNALQDAKDGGKFVHMLLGDDYGADEDETPLAFVHRMFTGAIDRTARAAVYESIAQESTYITVGKDKHDVMTFPLNRLIKAINGNIGNREARLMAMNVPEKSEIDAETDAAKRDAMLAKRTEAEKVVDRSIGFGPWRVAAKKLTEGYEKDGKRVEPVARWKADGTLEQITA